LQDGFAFDLSAAQWRISATDEKAFIEALAVRLEQALPDLVEVTRSHTLFSKVSPVKTIQVRFDTVEYRLQNQHGFSTEKAKVVRGIVLKTDAVAFSEWLTDLSSSLEFHAQQHADAREAMERFLMS